MLVRTSAKEILKRYEDLEKNKEEEKDKNKAFSLYKAESKIDTNSTTENQESKQK